ncbi:MAG: response regulator transcription factor [Clostridiales bacterium]|nr:response regulator transcription factor [Clostridiales bacterium]
MNYQCLIVDDEETICQTTCEYFNIFDVPSTYVTSYEEALEFLKHNQVDLLLLDINLGNHSGFELCKKLRTESTIPILFLSARTSDDDILTALNIGGDDYITKPYSLNILLAKVKAILKRCAMKKQPEPVTACNGIVLDYNYRQVIVQNNPIKLKDMEFRLLSYLVEHSNTVITKEELFDHVWQDRFIGDGTLSVHIRRLRQKIEVDPDHPNYIKTIWGIGYVFETKETV